MSEESRERARLEAEERVRVRHEPDGSRWVKVYFGGGDHLRNWLEQAREIAGEDNVRTEEIAPDGLGCFELGGEALLRVWVRRDGGIGEDDSS